MAVEYVDIETAAERMGVSARIVRRLVEQRRIPYTKLGGRTLRFSTADVDEFIAAGRVGAIR